MLIINDRHLFRLIDEYVAYYNQARPHQGLGQRIPDPARTDNDPVGNKGLRITCRPVLGGLHHDYRRAA